MKIQVQVRELEASNFKVKLQSCLGDAVVYIRRFTFSPA